MQRSSDNSQGENCLFEGKTPIANHNHNNGRNPCKQTIQSCLNTKKVVGQAAVSSCKCSYPVFNVKTKKSVNNVLNISDWRIPNGVYQILSKGLKFIDGKATINCKNNVPTNFRKALATFLHRLAKHKRVGPFTYKANPFVVHTIRNSEQQPDSNVYWDPPADGEVVEWNAFKNNIWQKGLELFKNLSSKPNQKTNDNSPSREIIADLGDRTDIIIKPADKGSMIVVLDMEAYRYEAKRQLNDTETYKRVNFPISKSRHGQINDILSRLNRRGVLSKAKMRKLKPDANATDRYFYLLPKIHKEKWTIPGRMPPGRPVVCFRGSDLYPISCWLDAWLQPLAMATESYTKNSLDICNELKHMGVDNLTNVRLQTADVEALYPSIDPTWGLQCVARVLAKWPVMDRPDEEILNLLQICLLSNDFVFEGERFLQIRGTAMGVSFSPAYANVVLSVWEENVFRLFKEGLLVYRRYIDDVLIVWRDNDKVAVEDFWRHLDNRHDLIKLTKSELTDEVVFLDLIIALNPLKFQTNFKKTDSRMLIHMRSSHPKHTIKGVLYSQALRYLRNSSLQSDAHKDFMSLLKLNSKRGYTRSMFRMAWQKAVKTFQLETAEFGGMTQCDGGRCKICNCVRQGRHWQASASNQWFTIRGDFDCASEGIIYVIECRVCTMQYIGQTTQCLRDRINGHKSNIKRGVPNRVTKHFQEHGVENLSCWVVDQVSVEQRQNEKALLTLECKYIKQSNSKHPFGMNEDHGRYSCSLVPAVVRFPSPWFSLSKILIEAWQLLPSDSPLNQIKPIIAHKLGRSTKSMVVKGRTESPNDSKSIVEVLECWPAPWRSSETTRGDIKNKFSHRKAKWQNLQSANEIFDSADEEIPSSSAEEMEGIDLLLEIMKQIEK